jgi:hypothetical protein
MFDDKSRYRQQPLRDHQLPDGTSVRHVLPRWIPDASDAQTAFRHRMTDSDRLDNLAFQNLGLGPAWWLIADANITMHPANIGDTPDERITIPLPGQGPIKG